MKKEEIIAIFQHFAFKRINLENDDEKTGYSIQGKCIDKKDIDYKLYFKNEFICSLSCVESIEITDTYIMFKGYFYETENGYGEEYKEILLSKYNFSRRK